MSRSHELQREREVQRYLQSWQVARGSPLNVALNVESIAQPDLQNTGYRPQASTDKALTAFAQLAVLRLNVKRAMVSLIDASTQVILAEATRNLRLADLDGDAGGSSNSGDDLWRTTVLSRPEAVCEHCFTNTITVGEADGRNYSTTGLMISDCRLDPRFKTRPYVQSEPGVRFYAGVPIVSRNGHQIGTYSVSDVRPRDGLDVDELQFMQSVSQAIMEHLEWARDRVDRFKGERIVRGLAAFIEGCSALSDDPVPVKVELSRASSTVRPPEITVSSRRGTITRANSFFRDLESKSTDGPASRPCSRPSSQKRDSSQPKSDETKSDGLSRMFHRASDILRHSTLADGVVLFGTTGANTRPATRDIRSDGRQSSDEEDMSMPVTSGSEGVGVDSSDSDTSPATRPCKILAYSLADERARADIEQDTALSLGTLEKYYALFPKGKAFSFTEEGAGVSSEDDSASDREPAGLAGTTGEASHDAGRRRKPKMDHKELLKKIPGAKSVVFLPLFDYSEDRLAGGCFLWTSVTGRMMNLDEDLSYLRAFGNSIMSEVGRINTQKNEAAKTTFIASMSHELRSPLHGILGAAEFLRDTGTDSYQSGLINSIATCGKTLLETLNHVLDYSKINRLGRLHMRRGGNKNKLINLSSDSFESLNMTATVDLGVLVEEVVDAIAAGHTFRKLPGTGYPKPPTSGSDQTSDHTTEPPVSVLLDISPRASWMVRTQPGALRRIIMNLFGNSLKYTSSGFILVSLRAQESADGSKVDALIRVVDTGKGMSEEFQRSRLFVPFSQEDSFQPGTGLGLSIVKQIVDSLGGTLEVKSQQGKGTEVDVRLRLTPAREPISPQPDDAIVAVSQQTKDLQMVLLDDDQVDSLRTNQQSRKLNEILVETCADWFDIKVTRQANPAGAALYLCTEPPSLQTLEKHFGDPDRVENRRTPIVVICMNVEEAVRVSQNQRKILAKFSDIIEVVPQPCGPRKLAKVMSSCFKRVEIMSKQAEERVQLSTSTQVETLSAKVARMAHMGSQTEQTGDSHRYRQPEAPAPLADPQVLSPPQSPPPPFDPRTPSLSAGMNLPIQNKPRDAPAQKQKMHVLLVDDNRINLQLLVMFMKKCGFTYEEAENGKEAVDKFEQANTGGGLGRFDFVLMDISMPIMNGMEATKRIREYESQHNLKPTTVMALTGLASADAQRDAKSAGIDVFLPKPVRFAELKKLLTHG